MRLHQLLNTAEPIYCWEAPPSNYDTPPALYLHQDCPEGLKKAFAPQPFQPISGNFSKLEDRLSFAQQIIHQAVEQPVVLCLPSALLATGDAVELEEIAFEIRQAHLRLTALPTPNHPIEIIADYSYTLGKLYLFFDEWQLDTLFYQTHFLSPKANDTPLPRTLQALLDEMSAYDLYDYWARLHEKAFLFRRYIQRTEASLTAELPQAAFTVFEWQAPHQSRSTPTIEFLQKMLNDDLHINWQGYPYRAAVFHQLHHPNFRF